jgi:hypothetical protein
MIYTFNTENIATIPMTTMTGPDRNKSRPAARSGAGQYLINQEKSFSF